MVKITIAAAQSQSIRGDVEGNVANHLRFARRARDHNADIVIFPELSLTGYEPDTADDLAMTIEDPRLLPLQNLSRESGIAIIAGTPLKCFTDKPNIGAVIIQPDLTSAYRKVFLHPGEEEYFSASTGNNGIFDLKGTKAGVAICADINHEEHARNAAGNGAGLYLAGVLMLGGYDEAAKRMRRYAQTYAMITVMANYGLPTGGYVPAGKSAAWDSTGELLAEAPEHGEALVIIEGDGARWTGTVVSM